jgi:hypothetical protein
MGTQHLWQRVSGCRQNKTTTKTPNGQQVSAKDPVEKKMFRILII